MAGAWSSSQRASQALRTTCYQIPRPKLQPDGLVPMHFAPSFFLAIDTDHLTFDQRFLYRRYLRQARKKNAALDQVAIPPAPNS